MIDIEDMDTGINIMDLGLNEFRLDLLAYVKENPNVEHSPFGMNAVVASSENAKPGVIFILKNRNKNINIDRRTCCIRSIWCIWAKTALSSATICSLRNCSM